MNYKIAICDDSLADRQYISSIVNTWARASENTVQLFSFSSAESLLFNYPSNRDLDMILA